MQFVTVRELKHQTPRVLRLAERAGPVVVTRYGKPVVILQAARPDDLAWQAGDQPTLPARRRASESPLFRDRALAAQLEAREREAAARPDKSWVHDVSLAWLRHYRAARPAP